MPWFPEREAGRVIVEPERERGTRLPFFEGLRERDAGELAESFAGSPVVDDPRHGRVEGREAFADYVAAMRRWILDATTGAVETIRVTRTPGRAVEEVSVKLNGDHPGSRSRSSRTLPMADVCARSAFITASGP